MSKIIYWVLALQIHAGKEERFKALSAQLIESARQEPGTLNYEWSLSQDGAVCHIYERYIDSAAIAVHIERNGPLIGELFGLATPASFYVYGEPDEAIKSGLSDLNPVYLSPLGGFSR